MSRRVAKLSGARVDPALAQAAQRHARAVAEDTTRATRSELERALGREGLADALIVPFSIVGARRAALDEALLAFTRDTAKGRAPTHVGVALAHRGGRLALVALFSRRLVELAPLPARLKPTRYTLRGRAASPDPVSAWVLGPCRKTCGAVHGATVVREKDVLAVEVDLTRRGWYLVELFVDGARGPEPAALWRVAVGKAGKAGKVDPWPGDTVPNTPPSHQIGRARRAADLAPLKASSTLVKAAQRHAEAVCRTGLAVHVLKSGDTPTTRARAAGFEGAVTENVAIATTAAQAHHNIMWSPGHRRNVMDPTATYVGIGIATRPAAPGVAPSTCLVELFGQTL
ncbi:MAG: CAP domain-containing protein [Deltaproteobacteria bacterium]